MTTHQHYREHNALVVNALRTIARDYRAPYPQIRDRFRGGDFPITAEFWRILNSRKPGQFVDVAYCNSCRKFLLTPALAA